MKPANRKKTELGKLTQPTRLSLPFAFPGVMVLFPEIISSNTTPNA
jgi:hypothetical protein